MTHLHCIVWAYERVEAGTGNYVDNTTLDLLCELPSEAMHRAAALIPGKQYRIHAVIEHMDGQPCSKG